MGSLDRRFPIYSRLVRLYPAPYAKKYVNQMLQTLADMLDDPENHKSLVWARVMADLPLSLFKQNLIYAGGIMKNQTPYYVKRNATVAVILLLPFFFTIITHIMQNNHISNSAVWQSSLYITLVGLPAMAFLLSLYTFLKWSHQRKKPILKNLFDIRHNWLTLAVGGLAFLIMIFVPFHDSTHCVTGNPVTEARQWHQTWHCIFNS